MTGPGSTDSRSMTVSADSIAPSTSAAASNSYPNAAMCRRNSRLPGALLSTIPARSFDTRRSTPPSASSVTDVQIERLRHRGCGVAERLGVRPLLALLGLRPDPVVDLTSECLVRALEFGCAVLDAGVEIVERSLQFVLREVDVGDISEGADQTDDLAAEVAERHLVGLDPGQLAVGPPQALQDSELRLAAVHHGAVPVDEPFGAELRVLRPRHVTIALAEEQRRLEPGELGEGPVAAEELRVEILPEHGVCHRIHEDREHLFARS